MALLAMFPHALSAEQRELKTENIEKVDAVLLLDASGSMRITDPNRLRDEGAKLFIQFLKPGDRLAILEFSDKVSQIRPLSPYEREQAESISSDIAKVRNDGTYTDLLGAISEAKAILQKNRRSDANPVIVLLSDGKMEPAPASGSSTKLMNDMINDVLPELKSDGLRVHTLSFSDQADKEFLSQISLGSDGVNWFTPNADKIHESYADLFLVVKKPQIVPLSGKGFKIDENIEEATFYINREETGEVTVVSPGGEQLTAAAHGEDVRWYSGSRFDVVTVINPEPGKWTVSGLESADGFATVLTNLKLITDWPSNFNADDTVLLEARLYEEQKPINLPQMTGAVKYAFQITPTDRISEPVIRESLVDDGTHGDKIADDGIFSASVSLADAGEYRLRIVASGPTFQRHQQIPFRVKARMVSLSVVSEGHGGIVVPGAAAGKEAGHHGEEAQGHAASPDGHAGHGAAEDGHGAGSGRGAEHFQVILSAEASALKQLDVKLIAVDGNRKRYLLPLLKIGEKGEGTTFEASTHLIPHAGSYEVQATLSGTTGKKEKIRAESKAIRYDRVISEAEEDHGLLIVSEDEPKPVPEGFPFVGILLVTLVNAATGAAMFFIIRRTLQMAGGDIPELPSLQPAEGALASLRKRVAVTELNINDPIFSGTDPAPPPSQAASAAPAAATDAAAESAASEVPDAEASADGQEREE